MGMADRVAKAAGTPKIETPPIKAPVKPDKLGVTQLVIGFLMAFIALIVFALLADQIYNQEAFFLDSVANPFLHAISSPALDLVMNGTPRSGPCHSWACCSSSSRVPALPEASGCRTILAVAIGGSAPSTARSHLHRATPACAAVVHVLPGLQLPSGTDEFAGLHLGWLIIGRWHGPRAGRSPCPSPYDRVRWWLPAGSISATTTSATSAAGCADRLAFVVALAFESIPRTWAARPWLRQRTRRRT